MSEKCHNNNNNISDNPLTSRRTDGGKNALEKMRTWEKCHNNNKREIKKNNNSLASRRISKTFLNSRH